MSSPKTSNRPTNSNDSFLGFKPVVTANKHPENDIILEYKLVETESTAVDTAFDFLFEKLTKKVEQ